MKEIDIGHLAKLTRVSTATIRFYEKKGLIKPIGRKGLRRQYSEHATYVILLIKTLKSSGLTLESIHEIFINENKINIQRDKVKLARSEIKNTIDNLNQTLVLLEHFENCPYEYHLRCPEFLKAIRVKYLK